ncbi:MAG: hypothetical protein CM15mV42_1140 [uncultured marine virus]|nr:MAG: hypothetical protein CM15mV42_1140 [uncultured marine virus]
MVKDGMKLGYGSLLEAITPFTYNEFLSQINTAEAALRGRSRDAFFTDTFGLTFDELINDFIKGYLKSGRNRLNLKRGYRVGSYNPSQSVGTVQSTIYQPHVVKTKSEVLYVFGDNAAENGKDGNRSVRDYENTFGIVYKKNIANTEENFISDEEFDAWVAKTEESLDALEHLISQYPDVVFPKNLIPRSEIKDVKKNSPQVFKYLKDALKQRFNYDLAAGTKGRVTGKGVNKRAIYIDDTSEVSKMIINTFPGQKINETQDTVALRRPSLARKTSARSFDTLSKSGIQTTNVKVGVNNYLEAELPFAYRINVGPKDSPRYRYFILDKYQSVNPKTLTETALPTGNYAEYIEFSPEGSLAQWGAGFMFSTENEMRPSTAEVRQYVKNINEQDSDPEGKFDGIPDNFEFGGQSLASQAIENGADTEYKDGKVFVNGKPASQTTEQDVEQAALSNDIQIDREVVSQESVDADNPSLQALKDSLGINTENTYEGLTRFWDSNIMGTENRENKAKLRNQGINTLEDFISRYKKVTLQTRLAFWI